MNTAAMKVAGDAPFKRENAWGLIRDGAAQPSYTRQIRMHDTPNTGNGLQTQSRTIAIRIDGWIHFVPSAEILVIEAQGNYVLLQCRCKSILLREPISFVAEGLLPYGFVRIHRSTIVNISCVEKIAPRVTGEYELRLNNGLSYTVSRCYKANLRLLADVWLGARFFVD